MLQKYAKSDPDKAVAVTLSVRKLTILQCNTCARRTFG